jgi:hypothetical protein
MYVKSSFPAVTWFRIAREELRNSTLSREPMKRKRQSGGTTDMKCSIRGARMGFERFSIRRATLVAL